MAVPAIRMIITAAAYFMYFEKEKRGLLLFSLIWRKNPS